MHGAAYDCKIHVSIPSDDCSVFSSLAYSRGLSEGKIVERGLMPCQWWWDKLMCLGTTIDASGSDASDW